MIRTEEARGSKVALAGAFTLALLVAIVGSLRLLVAVDGGGRLESTESHLERGARFESDGLVEPARSEYARAFALARGAGDGRLEARSASRLASLHRRRGDNARARELALRALEAARRARSEVESSEALFQLGYADASAGRLRESLVSFERSASIASTLGDAPSEARARLQYGLAAMMLERSESAREALERAAALARGAGEPTLEAAAVRGLGQLYSRLGESQRALERYAQARALARPRNDAVGEALILNAIGQVYFDMGRYDSALRSYDEARMTFHRLGDRRREAASSFEMGRCRLEMGDDEAASRRLYEARRIYRELGNPRFEADVLGELGRLAERRGDHRRALQRLTEAIALKRAAGDERFLAYTLNEAARLHTARGHNGLARTYLLEALELARKVRDPGAESLTLYLMALGSRGSGNLDRALSEAERAVAIVEELRARAASHALRATFLSEVHARYFLVVDLLARLHARRPEAGYGARAFEASERARARTLRDTLEESAADVRAGVEPSLLAEERRLRDRWNEAANERFLLPPDATEELAKLDREIDTITDEYDVLTARIRSQSPRYAALRHPRAPSLASLKAGFLEDGTRVLAYALGPERSLLWSVTRESTALYELPKGAEIEALARRARASLSSPRGWPRDDAALARLAELVLAPVENLPSTPRLLVVTEGALSQVPFGALPLRSGEPLVTASEIVRLPSLAVLPLLRASHREHDRWALVVADPVYGTDDPRIASGARARASSRATRGTAMTRLAGSGREAAAIAALAPPETVSILSGLDANRDRLERLDLSPFRVVHFATHAVVDDGRPELSGLALSLVDRSGKRRDGFLRLPDIYGMEIPADLVVLSACETALGAEVRGEGLVGLVRGFFYAGATSVIASAWRVEDEATAELMRRFYERLFAGAPKARALREAQLSMLADPRWRDPYDWAGFELQGDWR